MEICGFCEMRGKQREVVRNLSTFRKTMRRHDWKIETGNGLMESESISRNQFTHARSTYVLCSTCLTMPNRAGTSGISAVSRRPPPSLSSIVPTQSKVK